MRAAAVTIARTVSFERFCAGFFRGAVRARATMCGRESTRLVVVSIIFRMERIRSLWFWMRGWAAALLLLKDPNDLDEVFMLDRALPREVLAELVRKARSHPTGRAALMNKPRLEIDLAALRTLRTGT